MTNRHYKEQFDDEMSGVHKARRNAEIEEEEWEQLEEEERDFWRKEAEKVGGNTLIWQFTKLKESLLNLRDEILISLRLKKRGLSVEEKIVDGLKKFDGEFMKSMQDIKAGRCRNAQEFIDELDQGESDG